MDYRTAYEQLSKAIWKYDKTHGDAWVTLMREMQRIENNLYEDLPPIILYQPKKDDTN